MLSEILQTSLPSISEALNKIGFKIFNNFHPPSIGEVKRTIKSRVEKSIKLACGF